VIAVEPMVNAGRPEVAMRRRVVGGNSRWKPSAHFEHTEAVLRRTARDSDAAERDDGPAWGNEVLSTKYKF